VNEAATIKSKTDLVRLVGETVNLKGNGKEHLGLCPFHKDSKPSLSVNAEKQTWYCHSCNVGGDCFTWVEMTQKVDFQGAVDILGQRIGDTGKQIVATYDYTDPNGKLLYQVVRYEPKAFAQRRPDGKGGWEWNLKGVTPVLYCLPELLKAVKEGTDIYIVEGEKDVNRLKAERLVATCNPGGAGKWRPQYSDSLAGANCIIIGDYDIPGQNHAKQVANMTYGKAKSLKVLELQGGKDVSDWLDQGGTVEFLTDLASQQTAYSPASEKPLKVNYELQGDVIEWRRPVASFEIIFRAESVHQERTGIHARLEVYLNSDILSWSYCNVEKHEDRVRLANAAHQQLELKNDAYSKEELRRDLDRFCLGLWESYLSHFMPEMMAGSEENQPLRFLLKPYILEGGGTIVFAPAGRGKSYTALIWAVSTDAGVGTFWQTLPVPVLFINLERSAQSLRRRLTMVNRILGLDAKRPLLILNARGKSLYDVLPICQKAIKTHGIKLVVLDSISRAGFGDLTENRPVNAIIDSLSGLCDSWLALAHTPRQDETHLYGSIHFEAGADIIIQVLSQQKEDGTLGLGYQSQKQNDIPSIPLTIYALEFTDTGLSNFRKAKALEFLDIEEKQKKSVEELTTEFILDQETADASATQIANALGRSRNHISEMLRHSGKYIQTRKEGREVYYGVKAN